MKKIILVVVLLIVGLILVPQLTKQIVSITGRATLETGKEVVSVVKTSPEIQEAYQKFKEEVNESVETLQDEE